MDWQTVHFISTAVTFIIFFIVPITLIILLIRFVRGSGKNESDCKNCPYRNNNNDI